MKKMFTKSPLAKIVQWRKVLSFAIIFLLCIFPQRESEAKRVLLGVVEKKVGTVSIARGWKKMQPVVVGEKLYVGDRVKTAKKSRVLLNFHDGADIKLGENSNLRLKKSILEKGKKPRNVSELLAGALWASVDPKKKKAIFVIESQTAGVSIRGTELMIVANKDVSTIFLKSGALSVTGGDINIKLSAGEMTANFGKRRLIKPVTVTGRSDLQAVEDGIKDATSLDRASVLKKRKNYTEILARFYINYASYLVDTGSYYDAITVLLMAQSATKESNQQAEISTLIANIHARFLSSFDEAAFYYKDVLSNYPDSPNYEVSMFHYGLLLQTKGDSAGAKKLFDRYLKEFPNGRHSQNIKEYFFKEQK
ncbi:MAG: FecR domain-containing protein [Magnetococcales bacterium]|nr:FecR domain-containing protein [Magnetococcales bacterium]